MSVFDAYAAYYDLLYRDKDYAGEAAYVNGLVKRHAPHARKVLELGCGTGGHAVALSNHGYCVTGVDLSPAMITRAEARTTTLSDSEAEAIGVRPCFEQGDLRHYRSHRQFDAVLALFHVVSYQITNADLKAAMATAAAHLDPGGLFIFDCWYGPGVLADPPTVRVRRLRKDDVSITRIAEPVHFPNDNRVDVEYEVLVEAPSGVERIRETHPMRYLFVPEVDLILEAAGMQRLGVEQWMSGNVPGLDTWNACFVARK